MVTRYIKHSVLLLLTLLSGLATAQNYPAQSNPPRMVNDFAGIISASDEAVIEQVLRNYNDTTSTQIAVVTVSSLDGVTPSEYATELAHRWGVGGKSKDNGVLMLVKPKSGSERGEVFIAVGYGLEGAIPDAAVSKIIQDVVIPNFSKGAISQGVYDAVQLLMGLAAGEYTADDIASGGGVSDSTIVFITLIAIFILSTFFRRSPNSTVGSDRVDSNLGSIIFYSMLLGGRGHRGGSGGYGGGGFGGGSSFGGFGGGGFGGGGAGGSW